jgi:hypothetical protein
LSEEPARIIGLITAAITATIGLGTLLEWWSDETGGALAIAAGAWIAVAAEIIRSRVWPTSHVAEAIREACDVPPTPPIV